MDRPDDEPDPEWVEASISASLSASKAFGESGYLTTIQASCQVEGTDNGIELFYVRAAQDEGFPGRTIKRPDSTSVNVAITFAVFEPDEITLYCGSKAGDVVEKTVSLDGQRPTFNPGSAPSLELVEDTSKDWVPVGNLFEHAQVIQVRPPPNVSMIEQRSPTLHWRVTPHRDWHGDFEFDVVGSNGFGETVETLSGTVLPITDLDIELRVSGRTSLATTRIEVTDAEGQNLGGWEHPGSLWRHGIPTSASHPVTVSAADGSSVFFRRSFITDSGTGEDVFVRAALIEKQFCRSLFHMAANPLEACRDVVEDLLFPVLDDGITHGYQAVGRRLIEPGYFTEVTVLLSRPHTGEQLPESWRMAVESLIPDLAARGIAVSMRHPDNGDNIELADGDSLAFPDGAWMYPSPSYDQPHFSHDGVYRHRIYEHATAFPTSRDPVSFVEVEALLLASAYGIESSASFLVLAPETQRSLLSNVVGPIRQDVRTGYGPREEEPVEWVMGLPGE